MEDKERAGGREGEQKSPRALRRTVVDDINQLCNPTRRGFPRQRSANKFTTHRVLLSSLTLLHTPIEQISL